MEKKHNWYWRKIIIIIAVSGLCFGGASYDFYSMCDNTELFVSLSDRIDVVIDGQKAHQTVCSAKFTAAQRDTSLRYRFKTVAWTSKDMSIAVADGVENILWIEILFNYNTVPKTNTFLRADEQLTFTVNRLNGVEFYIVIEITADALSPSDFKLTEWAIVGIVFGSLVFVNIVAIAIGLTWRRKKKLRKLRLVGSEVTQQRICKQDNHIIRNSLSSHSNDERVFSRESTSEKMHAYRPLHRNPPTAPIGMVAEFLSSQKPSIREIPIARKGKSGFNNRTIFTILGKSDKPESQMPLELS